MSFIHMLGPVYGHTNPSTVYRFYLWGYPYNAVTSLTTPYFAPPYTIDLLSWAVWNFMPNPGASYKLCTGVSTLATMTPAVDQLAMQQTLTSIRIPAVNDTNYATTAPVFVRVDDPNASVGSPEAQISFTYALPDYPNCQLIQLYDSSNYSTYAVLSLSDHAEPMGTEAFFVAPLSGGYGVNLAYGPPNPIVLPIAGTIRGIGIGITETWVNTDENGTILVKLYRNQTLIPSATFTIDVRGDSPSHPETLIRNQQIPLNISINADDLLYVSATAVFPSPPSVLQIYGNMFLLFEAS